MKIRDRAPWAITLVLFWVALIACGDGGARTAGANDQSANGSPAASPAQSETPNNRVEDEDNHSANSSPKNVVQILNKTPGRIKIVSRVQMNRIRGDVVTPLNAAVAVGQDCTGCQTIAVALQLNLYVQGAHNVSPENYSIALNVRCTSCVTISHAIQFTLGVTDPEDDNNDGQDAKDAKKLLKAMQKELDAIAKDGKSITVDEAERRVEAVLQEFRNLGNSMREDLKRTTESNSPSQSPSPTATPTGSPASSPTTASPTSPSPSPSPSPTASP